MFPKIPPISPKEITMILSAIGEVIKTAKQIYDEIFDKKTEKQIKKIGGSDSYQKDNLEITDVIEINKILSEFVINIEDSLHSLERLSLKEIENYFDEITSYLKKETSIKSYIYGLDRPLKIASNEIIKLRGSLKKYTSQRVSLSDKECLTILKMLSGDKKTTAMDNFTKKVLNESVEYLISDINEIITNFYDDIEIQISVSISEYELLMKKQISELGKIELGSGEHTENLEKLKVSANELINNCQTYITFIREG